jgi:hypothetical protein
MPNGGLIAGFLNLANPINQIPMLLAGKMYATDCGILKEMLLKEPKTEHEKRTRIMTIARIFLSGTYPFSHNHRFGVLIDFLQFLALENCSMKMGINNIRIILERL